MKFLTILMGVLMLTSCMSKKLEHYEGTEPAMDIQAYFTGPIKAWGLIQDWRGRVTTRFDVDMFGEWKDGVGTLMEDFQYYDGRKQQRIWTIKKQASGTYTGTASDIIGEATGNRNGSAVTWHYDMHLPVDGTTYRLKFDDWMWQMNDGVVINRSYIKKFGITVAELTLFMQKQPD